METFLTSAATLAVLLAFALISSAGRAFRTTTLVAAWRWAIGASVTWLIVAGWSAIAPQASEYQELAWYAVALISLCPPIAVLGARRPGAAAWTWFVLLPMIAVLGWPMLTSFGRDFQAASLQLEAPQLIGFMLVLLMGSGNYIGTRYWLSACLYGVAVCLIVAPLSTVAPEGLSTVLTRQIAGVALGLSVTIAAVWGTGRSTHRSPLDRLWDAYRNSFGIVWANRLQERVNVVARQQSWPMELSPHGVIWNRPLSEWEREEAAAKLEQTLRWLLRRFVDPPWIDARLRPPSITASQVTSSDRT